MYNQLTDGQWLIVLIGVAILAVPLVLGALVIYLLNEFKKLWKDLKRAGLPKPVADEKTY